MGPTLHAQAYEGSEHAGGELTPGMERKLNIELAGERATLEETGAWTELLCACVRDLLSYDVDARGDAMHTLHATEHNAEGGRDACFRQDGLLQHWGNFAHPADQRGVRAPQNTQTATELVAVDPDEHEIARIKIQRAAVKQAAAEFTSPTSEVGETNDQGSCTGGRAKSQC